MLKELLLRLESFGLVGQLGEGCVDVGGMKIYLFDIGVSSVVERLASGLEDKPNRIYIFSDEWQNRKDQCVSVILSKLGVIGRRVFARKCVVKKISRANSFLDDHHVQGSSHLSLVRFGIFLGEELLGVMSLGRHSRNTDKNFIVMDRLCFKDGVQVVGGASKLFRYCVEWAKQHKYNEIITFSDNRWSAGHVYSVMGFELQKQHRPDYSYVKDGARFSKQSHRKSVSGCPDTMTELEWASLRGFIRIYDAGKKRWGFNLRPDVYLTCKEKNSKKCAEMHQNGVFNHSHIRGYFDSCKNKNSVYFGSSFELRCLFLLENNDAVVRFKRCDSFKGAEGWRNPDLFVEFANGSKEIWEIKPDSLIYLPEVQKQILDSVRFAHDNGYSFRVWTEKDSELGGEREIVAWAKKFLAGFGDNQYEVKQKEIRKRIRERQYAKIKADKVDVWCDFCKETHTALRLTYEKNIKRNGVYICERYGGHLAGKKPKLALRGKNPYAVEGKKQCTLCKEILEFSYFDVRKASWDGLGSQCKKCVSERNKKKYVEKVGVLFNRRNNPYASEGKKRCTGCKQILEFSCFHVKSTSWDGFDTRCKTCIFEKNQKRRDERALKTSDTSVSE